MYLPVRLQCIQCFLSFSKHPKRNIPSPRGCKSLPCLNGSGRKQNKIPCLQLVISKLLCLPDGVEGLNYQSEYHFENVSFGIQRLQIKILVLWNFNITHILVMGWENITKGFHVLLSWNSAMLTDHRRRFLGGDNVFQLFCSYLFLVSPFWDTTCFSM